MQSRSNSLVITDITYTDDQPAHVESQPTVALQNNAHQFSGQRRQREESSNESDEEVKAKRRKTENFVVDISNNGSITQEVSNGSVTQAKHDDSPAITNVEPVLNQETKASDELLELLACWQ